MAQSILVYTHPDGRHFCQQTEEFLSKKGVSFQLRDMVNDETAMDELMEI